MTKEDYINQNLQTDKYLRELIVDFQTTDNEEIKTALENEIINYIDEQLKKISQLREKDSRRSI